MNLEAEDEAAALKPSRARMIAQAAPPENLCLDEQVLMPLVSYSLCYVELSVYACMSRRVHACTRMWLKSHAYHLASDIFAGFLVNCTQAALLTLYHCMPLIDPEAVNHSTSCSCFI